MPKAIRTQEYRQVQGRIKEKYFPTIAFAIELDISDKLFETTEKTITEVMIVVENAKTATKIAILDKKIN